MATMLSFLPLVIIFSILLLRLLCSVCKLMVASFLSYRCAHVCCFLAVDPLCQLAKRNRWGGAAWTQLNTSETHSQLIVSPSLLSLTLFLSPPCIFPFFRLDSMMIQASWLSQLNPRVRTHHSLWVSRGRTFKAHCLGMSIKQGGYMQMTQNIYFIRTHKLK